MSDSYTEIPPIYLINLQKDKERLDFQKKQFQEQNLKFVHVKAIHGKNMSTNEKKKVCTNFNYETNTDTMIGCFLSHIYALKLFTENSKSPYAIIAEDDIIINKNFTEHIRDCISKISRVSDTSIVHLAPDGYLTAFNMLFFSKKQDDGLYESKIPVIGTWFYLVSQDSAKEIIKEFEKYGVSGHYDVFISSRKNVKFFMYEKTMAKHYNNLFLSNQKRNSLNSELSLMLHTPSFTLRPIFNLNITFLNAIYLFVILNFIWGRNNLFFKNMTLVFIILAVLYLKYLQE